MARKESGPFLSLATICHDARARTDGSLDLTGIVSRVTVYDTVESQPLHDYAFVVRLVAGSANGPFELALVHEDPLGVSRTFDPTEFEFTAERRVVQAIMRAPITGIPGTHWVSVEVDGKSLTRVSFLVERVRRAWSSGAPN